ncbi:MAG: RNA-splicing ligase RtcB [Chitinivibrionales bacterium]|nr:RNA-splicing ligase RtcB [Chitinivibrionales bacterium]
MIEIKGKYTTAKVMIDDVEPICASQIHTFVNHAAFTNPVAIMPDTHAGKGSVIGFTMKLSDRIIPNVVGVDIGCGMLSTNIGNRFPMSFELLDHKLRRRIPFGHNVHDHAVLKMKKEFPWHAANVKAEKFSAAYRDEFGIRLEPPRYTNDWFLEKCEIIGGAARRTKNSLGTLGGGNHFIEIGISGVDDYWITVHSGSRNFGKRVCDFWQNMAAKWIKKNKKNELRAMIESIRTTAGAKDIPRLIKQAKAASQLNDISLNGLEWLEGKMAADYLFDMIFAQTYAEQNRAYMAGIITDTLKVEPVETIETVHNYIDFNDFIIRKGAIRAYTGERMIIPFNMRDGILVCEGKSNAVWNNSAPHGAGRVMSRTQAKKELTVDAFKEQMQGIFSTSVGMGTLDESPDAYKSSKIIEEAIGETAAIKFKIKPLHNLKDTGGPPRRRK